MDQQPPTQDKEQLVTHHHHAVRDSEDSQLVGTPNSEVNNDTVLKRKRGRPAKGTPKTTPAPSRPKKEEEDVCFICFDGGTLVLCDRRSVYQFFFHFVILGLLILLGTLQKLILCFVKSSSLGFGLEIRVFHALVYCNRNHWGQYFSAVTYFSLFSLGVALKHIIQLVLSEMKPSSVQRPNGIAVPYFFNSFKMQFYLISISSPICYYSFHSKIRFLLA